MIWLKTAKSLHGVQEVGGSNPLTQIFIINELGSMPTSRYPLKFPPCCGWVADDIIAHKVKSKRAEGKTMTAIAQNQQSAARHWDVNSNEQQPLINFT
jgi:hypothetical protein